MMRFVLDLKGNLSLVLPQRMDLELLQTLQVDITEAVESSVAINVDVSANVSACIATVPVLETQSGPVNVKFMVTHATMAQILATQLTQFFGSTMFLKFTIALNNRNKLKA